MLEQIYYDMDAEVLLNTLLEELPDVGLITWNAQGRITSLSERCRMLMQLPASAGVGDPIGVLAQSHCRSLQQLHDQLNGSMDMPLVEEVFELTRDGESYWLKLSLRRSPPGSSGNLAFLLIVKDITSQREAIEQVHQARCFDEAALRSIPDAAVFTDNEGRMTKVSVGAERVFGFSEVELLGQPIDRLADGLGRQKTSTEVDEPHLSPAIQVMETVTKDGRRFASEVAADRIRDAGGKVLGSVAVFRDVSERLVLQDDLQQQASLLDSIFRQIPIALCLISTDRKILRMSDTALALFGCRQEQMTNHSIRRVYPSDEEFDQIGKQLYQGKADGPVVAELVDIEGRHYQGRIQMAPFYGADQALKGYLVAVEDVTAQLAYEAELHRYEHIVSASSDALVFVDQQQIYRAANQAYLKLWGKKRQEIIGAHVSDIICKERYIEEANPALERCFGGESLSFDAIEYEYPTGRRFVDIQLTPYHNEQGEIAGVLVTTRDITDNHYAQIALQESEEKFRAIFDHAPIGMAILAEEDGAILEANPTALRMYGYEPEELLGQRLWELVLGITPQNIAAEWGRVTERYRSRFESEHRRKDGSVFHVLVDASRTQLNGHAVFISTLVDISQQKQLELLLREQQSQYSMLVESSNAILFAADPMTFAFLFVSPEAENLLGHPVAHWLENADFWIDHLHPEDRQWAPDYRLSMVRERKDHDFDCRMSAVDGRVIWLHVINSVIVEEGNVVSLVGVMVDITARKEAEAERRLLSEMIRQSADSILLTDTDSNVTYINEAFTKLYGYSLEDLRGESPMRITAEADAKAIYSGICDELLAGRRVIRQLLNRRKDGSLFHCRHSITPLLNDRGDAIAYMGSQQDVSMQMKAEQALRESEEKYRQIVETAHEGIWVVDAEARTTFVNRRVAEMLGYAPEEMLGREFREFFDKADLSAARQSWERVWRESAAASELRFRRKDGSDLWCHLSTSVLLDENSQVYGAMALLSDISEKRQLTAALISSQKMEAIGQLTGGIAHDFNNILGSILGFAELAQSRFGCIDDKLHEYLRQIETAGGRARDLIRQLLIFSRGENTQSATSILLSPLIKEIIQMLRPMLPAAIEIRCELPPASPYVKVDPLHVQQLLMNLCINARDSIDESGLITVQVMRRSPQGERCAICGGALSGDWIAIRVSDTGRGIEASLHDDIFQPFVTGKEVGEGSGMGLAVVRGIINSYNGHLLLESALGRGSSFEILLPESLPEIEVGATQAAVEKAKLQLTGISILAVDDDVQFRAYIEELLSDAGAHVTCCHSGMQALGRLQRDGLSFDLTIIDQSMPGMSGTQMVQHLRELGCSSPVILCSGYGGELDQEMMPRLRIVEFLQKPVSRGALLAAIRHALEL